MFTEQMTTSRVQEAGTIVHKQTQIIEHARQTMESRKEKPLPQQPVEVEQEQGQEQGRCQ